MPVTGLRCRFFITILTVLMTVAIGSIYFYTLFLKEERLQSIDRQVREAAAALVDSDLGGLRQIDLDQADEIISEELGESRIGKFVIIRNSQGDTVFETASAKLLPILDLPTDQQWYQISTKGKFIRGLNLKLPRIPDRTLQVGLVLDQNLVDPGYFSKSSLSILVTVFLLGLVVSFFLTSFLLRPIALLDQFLLQLTTTSRRQPLLPLIPANVLPNPDPNSRDEFARVVAGLNSLISKVNKNFEVSRLWGYQMAHELKTPMALANLELERLQKRLNLSNQDIRDILLENQKISETINLFLG